MQSKALLHQLETYEHQLETYKGISIVLGGIIAILLFYLFLKDRNNTEKKESIEKNKESTLLRSYPSSSRYRY